MKFTPEDEERLKTGLRAGWLLQGMGTGTLHEFLMWMIEKVEEQEIRINLLEKQIKETWR